MNKNYLLFIAFITDKSKLKEKFAFFKIKKKTWRNTMFEKKLEKINNTKQIRASVVTCMLTKNQNLLS